MSAADELSADHAALLASSGIGTWTWDPSTDHVTWDHMTNQIYGTTNGEFDGTFESYTSFVHPDDVSDVVGLIQAVADRGGTYTTKHRIVRPNGQVRWVEGQGKIVVEDGTPQAGFGVVYDVTDRATLEDERDRLRVAAKAAEAAQTATERDLAYLIEVSDALTGSLNVNKVVERLATFIVPALADRTVIDVLTDDVKRTTVTVVCGSSGKPEFVQPEAAIVAERMRLPLGRVDSRRWVDVGLDSEPDGREPVAMAVPISARGARVGTVVAERTDGSLSSRAESLLAAVVRRSAVAIENSSLFQAQSTVTEFLTRAIRPPRLVEATGFDLATHYRPATDVAQLGGDFFDFFALGDSEWMALIGDVSGKGVEVAAQAGLMRAAARAAALNARCPIGMLETLNRTIRLEPDRPLATVIAVRLVTEETARRYEVATAGHPAPIILGQGHHEAAEIRGTLLGFVDNPHFGRAEGVLNPGESLVMYSDGASEARLGDREFGRERIFHAAAEVASEGARSITRAIVSAIEGWSAGRPQDDVTIVTATATAT